MKNKISSRNKSPYGWWIASFIERFHEGKIGHENKQYLAWENTILIKAKTRDQAYAKAIKQGRSYEDSKTGRQGVGKWVFEGLTSLLPIYDRLEDGAEVLWVEHRKKLRTIRSMLKKKSQLEAFQDD
jgi:hypothetical protein